MPKKKSTPDRPRDFSQLAKRIVSISTGDEDDTFSDAAEPEASKRGEARAKKLTPSERSGIAQKAAQTRWNRS
jgi:hypothetical protein